MSHHNTTDQHGRKRYTFPDHITRDGRGVWRDEPVTREPETWRPPSRNGIGNIDVTLHAPRSDVRQCIACGAMVAPHQSEACPHA